jgi:hypothetical protein
LQGSSGCCWWRSPSSGTGCCRRRGGALPLAIFLLGVPLAVLALIVFREGMVLRQEPTAGAPAYLVWDAPEVLVGLVDVGLGTFLGGRWELRRTEPGEKPG